MTIWPEKLKASGALVSALGEACNIDPTTIRHIELDTGNHTCVAKEHSPTVVIITRSGDRIQTDKKTAERISSAYQVRSTTDGPGEVILDEHGRSEIADAAGNIIGTAEEDDEYYISLMRIPRLLC